MLKWAIIRDILINFIYFFIVFISTTDATDAVAAIHKTLLHSFMWRKTRVWLSLAIILKYSVNFCTDLTSPYFLQVRLFCVQKIERVRKRIFCISVKTQRSHLRSQMFIFSLLLSFSSCIFPYSLLLAFATSLSHPLQIMSPKNT